MDVFLWRVDGRALSLDSFHVVGGQHAGLAGALHGAVHPALVDGLHVHDHVAVLEGNLVVVGRPVVVNGTHGFLQRIKEGGSSECWSYTLIDVIEDAILFNDNQFSSTS